MLKEFPSDRGFLDRIDAAPVVIDQWQLERLALVTRKVRVLFYVPGLPAEYYRTLWGTAYESAANALDALVGRLPGQPTVAVIPEGPYVLAKTGAEKAGVAVSQASLLGGDSG